MGLIITEVTVNDVMVSATTGAIIRTITGVAAIYGLYPLNLSNVKTILLFLGCQTVVVHQGS